MAMAVGAHAGVEQIKVVGPIGVNDPSIEPTKHKGLATTETVEFGDITTAKLENPKRPGEVVKYLFTNLEYKAIPDPYKKGENIYALIAREFDQKMLTEENINGLYRQGRLIMILNNSPVWCVSKTLFDTVNKIGCGQIGIGKTVTIEEHGRPVLKHKVKLRNLKAFEKMKDFKPFDIGHMSLETEKTMLIAMIHAQKAAEKHLEGKCVEGKMTREQAAELKQGLNFKIRDFPS